jgi:hypothetical protein
MSKRWLPQGTVTEFVTFSDGDNRPSPEGGHSFGRAVPSASNPIIRDTTRFANRRNPIAS